MLSSDYASFSLFGLSFTFICGLIIIILAFSLDSILAFLSNHCHRGEYSYLEWASTETLQLQKMAFQGVKSGTWSGSARSIPTTAQAGEPMANLPFAYPADEVRREISTSNIASKATTGTSIRILRPETSINSSESTVTRNQHSQVGTISSMATEAVTSTQIDDLINEFA